MDDDIAQWAERARQEGAAGIGMLCCPLGRNVRRMLLCPVHDDFQAGRELAAEIMAAHGLTPLLAQVKGRPISRRLRELA